MTEETLICLDCEKVPPEDDYGRSYGHRNCDCVMTLGQSIDEMKRELLGRPEIWGLIRHRNHELSYKIDGENVIITLEDENGEPAKVWVYDYFGKELTK